MASDYNYNPEAFYTRALSPCLPLFETVAPEPKQNLKITLHDFPHPEEIFHYSLRAINGKLTPVPSDGRAGGMLPLGLELDDSVFSPAWPSFPPTAIEICITNDPLRCQFPLPRTKSSLPLPAKRKSASSSCTRPATQIQLAANSRPPNRSRSLISIGMYAFVAFSALSRMTKIN
ncbi:hypothetical protein NA56DRAFT_649919 [Hyaloscypha hepaticicola]|uniref:Uncharacterized protein n=1 Tax=Hyaloscypha hepaticicola TaxID=2082293 RepID=A0A2J6PPA4_9HELO|nr:hypothetical protein NA56DRAFT_649919 [Hyaloscypha hepaticicola]